MERELSFEVVLRRKIPYVTAFLSGLLGIFIAGLVISDIFFLPTRYSSDEMTVAWYILVVPKSVKIILDISGIGLLIVLPLYLAARYNRVVTLVLRSGDITLQSAKIKIDIPVGAIRRVYCMDPRSGTGFPKGKLTIYFQRKGDQTIRVRLKDYGDSDRFMDRLMRYENIDFKMYNFNIPDFENEE